MAQACALYGLAFATVFTAISVPGIPRTVGLFQPVLLFVAVASSRVLVRYWLGDLYRERLQRGTLPGLVIYGAGAAGRQLAAALARSPEHRLVGFVDDDTKLHGSDIDGRRVHAPSDLPDLIDRHGVAELLLAMPSATRAQRNAVLRSLRHHPVLVRTLPGVADLATGRVSPDDLRDLDLEDLLEREPVNRNAQRVRASIQGGTVLVTGAGGSIGSELCRQIAACRPARLLLLDHSEFALYNIHQELQAQALQGVEVVPLLGSVLDVQGMQSLMQRWHPQIVYHAAAYKHVPLVEHNVIDGLLNNVWGTLRTALAAEAAGVKRFVLISTDKAVRPTNVMGASKRLAETVLQARAAAQAGVRASTAYAMVRFGNVLGSSGSVVPLFREQIRRGGPVTVTHPDVTRFFMTIPEAAHLVLEAGAMADEGDLFVLDMGEPVRIMDLARRMVQLLGRTVADAANPSGDIRIEVTGLRPGEKLFEELLIGGEQQPSAHPRIWKAREAHPAWAELHVGLQDLEQAIHARDPGAARAILARLVPDYRTAPGRDGG
jgi:FlaA1/EpsC-like NDP-sugar epimerase